MGTKAEEHGEGNWRSDGRTPKTYLIYFMRQNMKRNEYGN